MPVGADSLRDLVLQPFELGRTSATPIQSTRGAPRGGNTPTPPNVTSNGADRWQGAHRLDDRRHGPLSSLSNEKA